MVSPNQNKKKGLTFWIKLFISGVDFWLLSSLQNISMEYLFVNLFGFGWFAMSTVSPFCHNSRKNHAWGWFYICANSHYLPFFPCSREPPENTAVRVSHCKDSRISYWRWDDHTQNKELIDPGNYEVVCFQGSIRQRRGLFVPYVISRTLNSWYIYCRKIWHTLAGFVFLQFFYQYICIYIYLKFYIRWYDIWK